MWDKDYDSADADRYYTVGSDYREMELERMAEAELGRDVDPEVAARAERRSRSRRSGSGTEAGNDKKTRKNGNDKNEPGDSNNEPGDGNGNGGRHGKKPRKQSAGFLVFMKIAALAFIAASVIFMKALVKFDVLPESKLNIVLAIIISVTLAIAIVMILNKSRRWMKFTALALAIVISAGFGYGYKQFKATDSFFDEITNFNTQKTSFYLVAKKSDTEKTFPDDFKNKLVSTYLTEDSTYTDAWNKLSKLCPVTYEKYSDPTLAAQGLIGGSCKALYINRNQYSTICTRDKTFRKKTKIVKKISVDLNDNLDLKSVNVRKESFNIYISGLDVNGSIYTTSRSDVNMIVTVNPKTHKVLLTSIPRDTHVTLPDKNGAKDKLTHTGLYGIGETIGSAENLLGVDINYYLKVNYRTVIKFINAIGGVDVKSDYDFTTSGMKAHYHFKKGWNHLNGAKALAFARERHAFPDGDVQRNKDQQKIMAAVIKKMSSSRTLLLKYSDILKSLENYVQISMTGTEMKSLIKMQLANNYSWKVMKQGLKGTGAMEQCYSTGAAYVYVMEPDASSVEKVKTKIEKVMAG